MNNKSKISPARNLLRKRFFNTPERQAGLRETRMQMDLGEKIRSVREDAGITQAELAKRIGTTASAISRIEDADYDGHSVATLQRIAEALDLRLVIDYQRLTPAERAVQMR